MLLKIVRNALGLLIRAIDKLTRPRPLKRDGQAQAEVEAQCRSLTLYQLPNCPFCIKTRRTLHRLALPVALRNVQPGSEHRAVLEKEGGRIQSPCLRIEEGGQSRWLYESGDIIAYLEDRFGQAA
ncbi:glutathione S-transferase N-terminal domain-containing protein [Gallaecimonas sp. GXIMD4217]|uniref:glutaredoxin family protein n=1 Tax=Gallaecimonas sp. GXIMD4217 TaxID=3131927 RepID=UPI00311B0022